MTIESSPKLCGFSSFVCRACEHVEEIPAYCVLRVPEFEGYYSAAPSGCPYRLMFNAEWEEVVDE